MSAAPAFLPTRQTRRFSYFDSDGVLLYQVVRQDRPSGKWFSVRRPDGRGGWILGLGNVVPVLYRLPELLHRRPPGSVVCVVEGEAKVDRLVGLGLCATCSPFGAGAFQDRFSFGVSDADVGILPDLDEPGERHAQQVAASVHNVAASVAIVRLPGLHEPGDDVLDWLDRDGHTTAELLAVIDAAPLWTPPVAPLDHGHHGEHRPVDPPDRHVPDLPDHHRRYLPDHHHARVDDALLERARRVPILRTAEALGLEYGGRGDERRTVCPLHDDHRPSLRFSIRKNVWNCKPCQRGGDGIALVRAVRGWTFREACEWLGSL